MRDNFGELVNRLAKPGVDIIKDLTPESMHMLHMAVGISGEAGELIDAVKKAAVYNKPLDIDNVIEEMGDLEFYMEGLRQACGITRQHTIDYCTSKLNARYSSGNYSNSQAQDRADKAK